MQGSSFQTSKLLFADSFDEAKVAFAPAETLLIFDRKLLSLKSDFKIWLSRFPFRYGVESGENLKSLETFPVHARNLARIGAALAPRKMQVVSVGGGSVGDFAGFYASIFKRGVGLVHIPSTWLAAIDSSHGGKTALNFQKAKNQFGTFYPAGKVILVRSLLAAQPAERIADAMGEFGKIAIIDGGPWVRKVELSALKGDELLWKFLKPAIESKIKIVRQDPQELSGHRQLLNLGHTMGHVIEAAYGYSHGRAVAQGLFFALELSRESGALSAATEQRVVKLLSQKLDLQREDIRPLRRTAFIKFLQQDKKKSVSDQITFIFIRRLGRCERVQVSVSDLVNEALRQGWVR